MLPIADVFLPDNISSFIAMEKEIISHLYCDAVGDWHIQSNDDHCKGVSELAALFASEFGMDEWGRLSGLLHDRGKECDGFQNHIRRVSGYDCRDVIDARVEHSFVGAVIAHKMKEDVIYWLSNVIAGHHRGLYDMNELKSVLARDLPPEINSELPTVKLVMPTVKPQEEDISHLVRMMYSALVDADWLDTERFMNRAQFDRRRGGVPLQALNDKLEDYCRAFIADETNQLNKLRTEIQNLCREKSGLTPGFFSLTVPTGGGKTIASIIWAINHAMRHGKKRIIIAIPYTSIIIQTAQTLKNIFGEDNVIEHHSALDESCVDERSRLACENWDAPIVVTTNVQLFESIFSNRPSTCRKLHSLCNSVVILDEVQSLPMSFLQPIVDAMRSYVKLFGVSFLLCTASQPVLDGNHRGLGMARFNGLSDGDITPIVTSAMELHDKFRRVSLEFDEEKSDIESLCRRMKSHDRVLCIVNSRKEANEIFAELASYDDVPVYHLSRMMCQAHIQSVIIEIKAALSHIGQGVRVVSTQLIEAGVDIDFPVVYRQMAGLDSIVQAAGRCNREGHQKDGSAIVFQLLGSKPHGSIKFAVDATKRLISRDKDRDWLSPETMREYFEVLYSNTPDFDIKGINEMLFSRDNCQFEEASKKFEMIDEDGLAVVVNYGEAEQIISRLKNYGPSRNISRALGRYSVTVKHSQFKEFQDAGLIEEPFPGFYYIPLKTQYDGTLGLKTSNEYVEQTMII